MVSPSSSPSLGSVLTHKWNKLVFSENAGGSQVLGSVADRISSYLLTSNVQMANYALAQRAAERVARGTAAAAFLVGAQTTDEVMLGASATQLAETISRLLEEKAKSHWAQGDEVVVSEADHEGE